MKKVIVLILIFIMLLSCFTMAFGVDKVGDLKDKVQKSSDELWDLIVWVLRIALPILALVALAVAMMPLKSEAMKKGVGVALSVLILGSLGVWVIPAVAEIFA